jgi:8-oxoguanine DNA glycosylase-like protein
MRDGYRSLRGLLARELARADTGDTRRLVAELRAVRRRGYMTRNELLKACAWKSPRARRFYEKNSPAEVRRISRLAFSTDDERERFDALTSLHGVGAPMASAILTLTDPRRYGVIDVRVWRALYKLGSVRTKPSGVGFTFEDWRQYLVTLRRHAKELRVSVRRVEYSLFLYHQRTETGRLYER